MLEHNHNPTTIHLNFTLDYNIDITLPGRTSLEEIEKYILSKFVINSPVNLLQSINGKLSKKEKSTIIGMSKFNEFSIDLIELFKVIFKKDDFDDKDTTQDFILHKPPFIPSFLLKFDENDLIGAGSFGKTYKSYYHNKTLAIKFLNQENINTDLESSFERELNTYIKLSHRNIPKFLGITYVNGKGKGIIMENIEGNKLINLSEISEVLKLQYLIQLAEVVQYLHENDIFHRDLKPDNILVTQQNDVWEFEFKSESQGVFEVHGNPDPLAGLKTDCEGVPMMLNLKEQPELSPTITTNGDDQNIWFTAVNNALE